MFSWTCFCILCIVHSYIVYMYFYNTLVPCECTYDKSSVYKKLQKFLSLVGNRLKIKCVGCYEEKTTTDHESCCKKSTLNQANREYSPIFDLSSVVSCETYLFIWLDRSVRSAGWVKLQHSYDTVPLFRQVTCLVFEELWF